MEALPRRVKAGSPPPSVGAYTGTASPLAPISGLSLPLSSLPNAHPVTLPPTPVSMSAKSTSSGNTAPLTSPAQTRPLASSLNAPVSVSRTSLSAATAQALSRDSSGAALPAVQVGATSGGVIAPPLRVGERQMSPLRVGERQASPLRVVERQAGSVRAPSAVGDQAAASGSPVRPAKSGLNALPSRHAIKQMEPGASSTPGTTLQQQQQQISRSTPLEAACDAAGFDIGGFPVSAAPSPCDNSLSDGGSRETIPVVTTAHQACVEDVSLRETYVETDNKQEQSKHTSANQFSSSVNFDPAKNPCPASPEMKSVEDVLRAAGDPNIESMTMSIARYLDMRIGRFRSILDWRINELTRVIQQTEGSLEQQLEGERRTRQDSVSAVQHLVDTQKIILEAHISGERSRLDAALRDLADCQLEIKVLSENTSSIAGDVKVLRDMTYDHSEANAELQRKMQLDQRCGTVAAEERKPASIDALRQGLKMADTDLQVRSDGAAKEFDVCSRREMLDMLNSHAGYGKRIEALSEELHELQQETFFRATLLQERERCNALDEGYAAERRQWSKAVERMQEDLQLADAQTRRACSPVQEDVPYQHSCSSAGGSEPEAEELLPNEASPRFGHADRHGESIGDLAALLNIEAVERKHAIEGLTCDVDQWKTLFAQYVSESRERMDSVCRGLDDLKAQQLKMPSAEALEATLDGRNAQLVNRLNAEQGERRDAVKQIQSQLNDMQTVHGNNSKEFESYRRVMRTTPGSPGAQPSSLGNEVRELRDSISSIERDMKLLEVTYQTTMAQEKGRTDLLFSQVADVNTSILGGQFEAITALVDQRVNDLVSRFDYEQQQRKDAFDAVQRDLTSLPALFDMDFSNFRESLSAHGERLDTLGAQIGKLIPEMQEVAERFEGEVKERKDDAQAMRLVVASLPTIVSDTVSKQFECADGPVARIGGEVELLKSGFAERIREVAGRVFREQLARTEAASVQWLDLVQAPAGHDQATGQQNFTDLDVTIASNCDIRQAVTDLDVTIMSNYDVKSDSDCDGNGGKAERDRRARLSLVEAQLTKCLQDAERSFLFSCWKAACQSQGQCAVLETDSMTKVPVPSSEQ